MSLSNGPEFPSIINLSDRSSTSTFSRKKSSGLSFFWSSPSTFILRFLSYQCRKSKNIGRKEWYCVFFNHYKFGLQSAKQDILEKRDIITARTTPVKYLQKWQHKLLKENKILITLSASSLRNRSKVHQVLFQQNWRKLLSPYAETWGSLIEVDT